MYVEAYDSQTAENQRQNLEEARGNIWPGKWGLNLEFLGSTGHKSLVAVV